MMGNDISAWRATIGVFNNCRVFSHKGFKVQFCIMELLLLIYSHLNSIGNAVNCFFKASFNNNDFNLILIFLLLEAGDVESNPGPENAYCLSLLHCNIRSIRKKLDYIYDFFIDNDILCFTETHLDNLVTNDDILISDKFDCPYRKDRTNHGGGILVYLSKNILHERISQLEVFCEESIWVKVKKGTETLLLGVFYSPKTADATFFEKLNKNIELAYTLSNKIIIIGDLNEDLYNPSFHNLKDVMLINSLKNVIENPTRVQALLDPIIIPIDMPYLDADTISVPSNISDHKATCISLPFHYDISSAFERTIFLYSRADFDSFNNKLMEENWDCLNEGTVNEACNKFTEIYMSHALQTIPQKRITVRPDDRPWFDSELRKNCKIRNRLKSKATRSGKLQDWEKYKKARNKVSNMKKKAKENFYNNLELDLTNLHVNDKKSFWKIIRHFVKGSGKTNNTIPPLQETINGQSKYFITNKEKADFLNFYFSSISRVNEDNVLLPDLRMKTNRILNSISITENEVQDIIKTLDINKACGSDSISHRMLKNTCLSISKPLSILFNRSISEGIYPDIWKIANVTPLFKKGDKSDVSNYRPVSLLSCCGKLFERIVFKYMYNFLLENGLLYKYQSGFLPNHSTTLQLIDIYHHICQSFDNRQISCMVFCDISKAFDRVWHKGLLFKLQENGIHGNLLTWLSSYLSNRYQRVVLQSSESSLRLIQAGVPQGSVLGPLLFLIYVNDIADNLLSLTRLYADDSSLYYSASSINDIEGIINHDLNLISHWSKQWLVKFNPNKTEFLYFSLRTDDTIPKLYFENAPINLVADHKHLGVTLSSNGQWKTHIENILSSASKVLGIMRKFKYTLNRESLNQIYISYVRPLLEYSSIVWAGCTEQQITSLERIQNEAARIVTGLTRSVSLENLYNECGWESLKYRRDLQKYYFMYRTYNSYVPQYIVDLFPLNVQERTNYNLRNPENFTVPYCRTEILRKSCVPSAIELWNNLDYETKTASSMTIFKGRVRSPRLTKTPLYYYHGKRTLSVLHCKIRNNCSNLNADLFNNHLSESPLCLNCNIFEDAEHYFFNCRLYQNQRQSLFNETREFHPLSTRALLYGNDSLSLEGNKILFESVHKYIKNTKRF